ncbi:MAG: hypothetical protein II054_02225 [Treponema sp.]|nr:hypothetical protein [Treponema sp.]MBR6295989.1 hypothetical protein [Treponema sp.]
MMPTIRFPVKRNCTKPNNAVLSANPNSMVKRLKTVVSLEESLVDPLIPKKTDTILFS